MKKKKKAWATRKRGTPSQIGTRFPIMSRTPMQVKSFKQNLRKLKPRTVSPFQTPNPLTDHQEPTPENVEEEQMEIEAQPEKLLLKENQPTKTGGVSPTQLYHQIKNTANSVLSKLGLVKKRKPPVEDVEEEEEEEAVSNSE